MTISDSPIILGRIIQELSRKKYAQVEGYANFILLTIDSNSIKLKRQKGTIAIVPLPKLIAAIDFYKRNFQAYDDGPSRLREFGLTHITSPVFALLHLVPKKIYTNN